MPTISKAADGTLLVYFVSDRRDRANPTNEIYLAARRPGQGAWDPAVRVADVNDPTEHDHLPFAARTGAEIALVWVRHDTSQALPWLNPQSDLFYATSADGRRFSPPTRITHEPGDVVNLFPALYPSLDGRWSLVWLSTRLGPPRVFELPLANADSYPAGLMENELLGPATPIASRRRRLRVCTWAHGYKARTARRTSTIASSEGREMSPKSARNEGRRRPERVTAPGAAYMYVWEFLVAPEHAAAFERAYGESGEWVQLFRSAPGYVRSELHRDRSNPLRYVTIDYWESQRAWEAFRSKRSAEFEALDGRCEQLTTRESEIGRFERVE